MFEGLEKVGTRYTWTRWDKVLFALNLMTGGYLVFILIFEPGVLIHPHDHSIILRLANLLVPIGVCAIGIAISRRVKRRHAD